MKCIGKKLQSPEKSGIALHYLNKMSHNDTIDQPKLQVIPFRNSHNADSFIKHILSKNDISIILPVHQIFNHKLKRFLRRP